jgi:hypothetical protein
MKFILIPVLLPLAYVAFANSDKIVDQYRAAYPSDPTKRAAIEHCALSAGFSRLDPDDREACYAAAGVWPASLAPAPHAGPYYPYGQSHSPENDIRRGEATKAYQAAPAAPPPAFLRR